MVGPFFGGPITDYLGRRRGMVIGSAVICLGSAIIASAPHQPQFVAGRFILGFGVSILTVSLPFHRPRVSSAISQSSASRTDLRFYSFVFVHIRLPLRRTVVSLIYSLKFDRSDVVVAICA